MQKVVMVSQSCKLNLVNWMHRLLVPGDYWSYTLRLPRKVNMKMNLLEKIFKSKNMNQK